jgi:diacylglycerol kinase (ATP)
MLSDITKVTSQSSFRHSSATLECQQSRLAAYGGIDSHFSVARCTMVIVFNPCAGRRRAALLWQVVDILAANGLRIELLATRGAGDAEQLARKAARDGASMVVAAGGDGTIAEVANGLTGFEIPLGIIPLGTANVLAHELALPFAPGALAAALAFGRTELLWPGIANGPEGPRLFVQMLGAGFDAHVVHHMPLGLKRIFGRGAYALQSLWELARYEYRPIRLRLDGHEAEAASVIVSKGRLYAGRHMLSPGAQPREPGFSVVLFQHAGVGATLLYGAALLLGTLANAPGVQHVRARQIDLLGNEPTLLQTDGDKAGFAPVSIQDAPVPIRLVIASH